VGPDKPSLILLISATAEEILSPTAKQFLTQNPGLTLQFLTSGENVNFSRWEADLAQRPKRGRMIL
jgi:hypothetical protein